MQTLVNRYTEKQGDTVPTGTLIEITSKGHFLVRNRGLVTHPSPHLKNFYWIKLNTHRNTLLHRSDFTIIEGTKDEPKPKNSSEEKT